MTIQDKVKKVQPVLKIGDMLDLACIGVDIHAIAIIFPEYTSITDLSLLIAQVAHNFPLHSFLRDR